MSGNF
jgi:hypothetical protein